MFRLHAARVLFICFIVLSPTDAQEAQPMLVLKPEQIFALVERLMENLQYTVAGAEHLLGPIGLQKRLGHFSKSFELYGAQSH